MTCSECHKVKGIGLRRMTSVIMVTVAASPQSLQVNESTSVLKSVTHDSLILDNAWLQRDAHPDMNFRELKQCKRFVNTPAHGHLDGTSDYTPSLATH